MKSSQVKVTRAERRLRKSASRKRIARVTGYHAIVGFFAAVALVPFIWVVMSSFKASGAILTTPFSLPEMVQLTNYMNAWRQGGLATGFRNTMIVVPSAVALTLLVTTTASYAIARVYKSTSLYLYFTAGIMVPLHAIVIPVFIMFRELDLTNSLQGLILVNTVAGIPLAVLIMVGFFSGVPDELEEAPYVDGANTAQVFFHIILPMARPGLATVTTLTFINVWNEFLFAVTLNSVHRMWVLTQSIRALQGTFVTDFGLVTAGVMITVLPVMLVFVFLQEYVTRGLTAGAVKG